MRRAGRPASGHAPRSTAPSPRRPACAPVKVAPPLPVLSSTVPVPSPRVVPLCALRIEVSCQCAVCKTCKQASTDSAAWRRGDGGGDRVSVNFSRQLLVDGVRHRVDCWPGGAGSPGVGSSREQPAVASCSCAALTPRRPSARRRASLGAVVSAQTHPLPHLPDPTHAMARSLAPLALLALLLVAGAHGERPSPPRTAQARVLGRAQRPMGRPAGRRGRKETG